MAKTAVLKPTEEELAKIQAERTAQENLEKFATEYDSICKKYSIILVPDFSAPVNKMGVVPRAVQFKEEGEE